MFSYNRFKNQVVARIIGRFPALAKRLVDSHSPWESEDIPWTPVTRPLSLSQVSLVTTAGVHLKSQTPFNMQDPYGDPTYREISAETSLSDLMITHDYYDHTDADKDLNIVFPLDRLHEFKKVKPPRSIFLKWPFGHPLGEPFQVAQQRAVLTKAFEALQHIKTPGEIVDIPFRWKKETY